MSIFPSREEELKAMRFTREHPVFNTLLWLFLLIICIIGTALLPEAAPVLVPYIKTQLPNGYIQFETRLGGAGWWRDDEGVIHETVSELTPSDGVWDIENTSAPHKVYAATDEVRWRVDPPAGEAAGFEIAFSTVSLYLFDEGGDVEKTIPWPRAPLNTTTDGTTITYPLFSDCTLYVLSTPEGYKTNFYLSNPASIPDPQSLDYFGVSADLSKVYFAVRYSVSKWPSSPMMVDGEPFGPGSITDGYSATFGDDLWMLPTKAYRNVEGFNGESWHDAEDESYVYYVFDRLAQEILVLAPYTLFVGAQNVVIDPTTWTSGQTSADDATFVFEGAATTNYGTNVILQIGDDAAAQATSLLRFASIPSANWVKDVSARIQLTYSTQNSTNTMPVGFKRVDADRDWVEAQTTWNIYKTANNWTTAGALGAGTDYDNIGMIPITVGNAANLILYNNSTFNSWITEFINSDHASQGMILDATDGGTASWKQFHSDDAASAANRPLFVITYSLPATLPILPTDTTYVGVEAGSVLARIVVDATSTYLAVADIANDVTADLLLDTGTQVLIGNGAGADDNWDVQAAADLVGGGSMFVLASNYALSDAAGVALYFNSSLTAIDETRYYGLSPSGGGSVDLSALANRVDDATALLGIRLDTVDSDIAAINTLVDDVETNQGTQSASLTTIEGYTDTLEDGQTNIVNTIAAINVPGGGELTADLLDGSTGAISTGDIGGPIVRGNFLYLMGSSVEDSTFNIEIRSFRSDGSAGPVWSPTAPDESSFTYERVIIPAVADSAFENQFYRHKWGLQIADDVNFVTGTWQITISGLEDDVPFSRVYSLPVWDEQIPITDWESLISDVSDIHDILSTQDIITPIYIIANDEIVRATANESSFFSHAVQAGLPAGIIDVSQTVDGSGYVARKVLSLDYATTGEASAAPGGASMTVSAVFASKSYGTTTRISGTDEPDAANELAVFRADLGQTTESSAIINYPVGFTSE